jgi:TolB protein
MIVDVTTGAERNIPLPPIELSFGFGSRTLAWSPDGASLATPVRHDDGAIGLALVDVLDGAITFLATFPGPYDTPIDYISWSPDGSRLLFTLLTVNQPVVDGTIGSTISTINADGSALATLYETPDNTMEARFSPDASRIAFVGSEPGPRRNIYLMNDDGTDQRRLTNSSIEARNPRWSPDGNLLLYVNYDGSNSLTAISPGGVIPEGSGQRAIISGSDAEWAPVLGPLPPGAQPIPGTSDPPIVEDPETGESPSTGTPPVAPPNAGAGPSSNHASAALLLASITALLTALATFRAAHTLRETRDR